MRDVSTRRRLKKVIAVNADTLMFNDNVSLTSDHDQDCCESHYLDFSNLHISDFEGMLFDLSSETFFEKAEGFGIRLIPVNGHPVGVPGYGYNNGYYSSQLSLVLTKAGVSTKFDISECQVIGD